MSELELYKKLLQDPHRLDDESLAQIASDSAHQKVLQQMRELDQKIEQALHIEVPEGLEARILLNQSYAEMPQQESVDETLEPRSDTASPTSISAWLGDRLSAWQYGLGGLVASLLVAVLLFNTGYLNHLHEPLTGEALVAHIIEHVEEDPNLMAEQAVPHTAQELQNLFASVGATLQGRLEGMSYAGECVIDGQRGLHLVMQDKTGPVTVIVMPGPQIEAMQAFKSGGYMGELLPVKGGMVAIVGDTMEQLALAQIRFFSAVKFA